MKKETLQQNLPAIIAISLPVLLVLVIAFLTMLPNLGPKPQYDFIFIKESGRSQYVNGTCKTYKEYYDVVDSKIEKKPFVVSVFDKREIAEPCYGYSQSMSADAPDLFVYDVSEGVVKPVTFEQAQGATVVSKNISPDGFAVSKRIVNRGILELFGDTNDGVFISKNNSYIKIDLGEDNLSYYDTNFGMIGWIEPVQ